MTIFETIMALVASGIFTALLALFYRFGRNQERIDNSFTALDNKFKAIDDKLSAMDTRLSNVEKDIQQLNTRMAVVESRLNDISNNVNHLMWHNQALPHKEVKEE